MGFDKLREWVGTVTGKGVSWGRDSVGRSAPTFMAASTPAPPPTYLHGERPTSPSGSCCFCCEAGQLWAVRLLQGLSRAENPLAELPAVALFSRLCFACLAHFACHAHCPHQVLAPIQQFALPSSFIFASFAPVHLLLCACHLFMPCAPGSSCRFVATVCQGQQFASC